MNSSKTWGDNLEQIPVGPDPLLRQRLVRAVVLLLILVALAVGAAIVWRTLRRRCEPLLTEARQSIEEASSAPVEFRAKLRDAESLLREYIERGGQEPETAELLLCVAMTLRYVSRPDPSTSEELEIDALLDRIDPKACTAADLSTAIHVFLQAGRLAQADWLLDAALPASRDRGDYLDLLRLAADLRYDLGHEEAVLEHCREWSGLDPGDPEPWRLMAMVHEDSGYHEPLILALKNVIEREPGDVSAERLKLIRSLIAVGDRNQARAEFALLAEENAQQLDGEPLLEADLLMLEGKSTEAQPIIERVLQEDPTNRDALLLRGKLLLSENRLEEAAEILERLLDCEAMHPEAHYVLGQVYARNGKTEQARQHLTMHRQILDTRVRIHGLERRAGRDPNDTQARQELIRLYEQLGMHEHADFWRRAARSAGNDG